MSLLGTADLVSLAVTTAVFYEYGLTLAREVRQYWGHRFDIPSAVFFANRYLCLISRAVVLSAMFAGPSDARCSVLVWCAEVYAVIGLLVITLLSAARVYTLWYGTIWPSLLVIISGLVLPVFSIAIMKFTVKAALSNYITCNAGLQAGTSTYAVYFIARSISIVPDILVVVFTWTKAYGLMASARAAGVVALLPRALLRTGIQYFAAVVLFNTSLLLLTLATDVTINTSDLVALAAIMMSRFMLYLRQTTHSKWTVVQTTRYDNDLLGNMGEYLDDDWDSDWDSDSESDADEMIFEPASGVQDPTGSVFDFVP
ncbi:uncharacterized protein B0H18DRAFT_1208273 [Fomitopsis serialis]|uniref:uncharacterized protein n=1 Tax=Fomitopsis serialis TaxID=139415 RepID=UPI00200892A5|nr:uncharacterized protein B0H18DRAFT_1208273 [Neoantrodia serialis]KAH9932947.1 hypothetical protein B0H18DRAFT_1208273 [Neoantrodia serialis]